APGTGRAPCALGILVQATVAGGPNWARTRQEGRICPYVGERRIWRASGTGAAGGSWASGSRTSPPIPRWLAAPVPRARATTPTRPEPAPRVLRTRPPPATGQRVSLAYLLPQSVDDLIRQRRMYECLVRRAGGVAARLPQHLATVVSGLYDVRALLGTADP